MTVKQITALILTMILCLCCMPFSCLAEESGDAGNGLSWAVDNGGTLVISGNGYMPDYEPGQTPWVSYAPSVTSVIVSSGVKSVGNYAFFQFTALNSCSLPEGLESIGTYALGSCTALRSIIFPASLSTLGDAALYGCTSLREIRFGGDAPSFGTACFYNVSGCVYADCLKSGWGEASTQMYGGSLSWEIHTCDENTAVIEQKPDCTTPGKKKLSCICCGAVMYEDIAPTGHSLEHFDKAEADCQNTGNIEYWHCTICDCCYSDKGCNNKISPEETVIPADHDIVTEPGLEPTEESPGYTEKSYCRRCGEVLSEKTVLPALGYACAFSELSPGDEIDICGTVYTLDSNREIRLPDKNCEIASNCVYSGVTTVDGNGRYPVWLRVYILSYDDNNGYTATRCTDMDNLLGYSGMSVKTKGGKGIRLMTSMPEYAVACLSGEGLKGFKLIEYGTVAATGSSVPEAGLTLATPGALVLPASEETRFFTGVLNDISNEQCSVQYVLRPYMKLSTPAGRTAVVYGGSVTRSPGYIALQNKNDFSPGTEPYKYIWSIIHLCYGNAYDAEYVS